MDIKKVTKVLKGVERMEKQIGSIEEVLGEVSATGAAGGGMVEVEVNGRMELVAVHISPEAVDPNDLRMLEDLIVAAFAAAIENVKEEVNAQMSDNVDKVLASLGMNK